MSARKKPPIIKRVVKKAIPRIAKAVALKPEEVVKVRVTPPPFEPNLRLARAPTLDLDWHTGDDPPIANPMTPRYSRSDEDEADRAHHSPESEGDAWGIALMLLFIVGIVAGALWWAMKPNRNIRPQVEPAAASSASAQPTAYGTATTIATPSPTTAPTACARPTVDADDYGKND